MEGYGAELTIGPRTGKRPQLPEHMNTQTAESSRLLDAARSINEQRKERQANAISFRTVRKEGEPLV